LALSSVYVCFVERKIKSQKRKDFFCVFESLLLSLDGL